MPWHNSRSFVIFGVLIGVNWNCLHGLQKGFHYINPIKSNYGRSCSKWAPRVLLNWINIWISMNSMSPGISYPLVFYRIPLRDFICISSLKWYWKLSPSLSPSGKSQLPETMADPTFVVVDLVFRRFFVWVLCVFMDCDRSWLGMGEDKMSLRHETVNDQSEAELLSREWGKEENGLGLQPDTGLRGC